MFARKRWCFGYKRERKQKDVEAKGELKSSKGYSTFDQNDQETINSQALQDMKENCEIVAKSSMANQDNQSQDQSFFSQSEFTERQQELLHEAYGSWLNTLNALKVHKPNQAIVELFCRPDAEQYIKTLERLLDYEQQSKNGKLLAFMQEIIQKSCSKTMFTACMCYFERHGYINTVEFFKAYGSNEQQQYLHNKEDQEKEIYDEVCELIKNSSGNFLDFFEEMEDETRERMEKFQVALYYEKRELKKEVVSEFLRLAIQNISKEEKIRIFSYCKAIEEADIILMEYASNEQIKDYKIYEDGLFYSTWGKKIKVLNIDEPNRAIMRLFCSSEIEEHIKILKHSSQDEQNNQNNSLILEEIKKIQKKCSGRTATICVCYLERNGYENASEFFREDMPNEQKEYLSKKLENQAGIHGEVCKSIENPAVFTCLFQDTKNTMQDLREDVQVALYYEKKELEKAPVSQQLRSLIQNRSPKEIIKILYYNSVEAGIILKEYASSEQMSEYNAYEKKQFYKMCLHMFNDLKTYDEPDQVIMRLFCNPEIEQRIKILSKFSQDYKVADLFEKIRKIQEKCSESTATICFYYLARNGYHDACEFFGKDMSDKQRDYIIKKTVQKSQIYQEVNKFIEALDNKDPLQAIHRLLPCLFGKEQETAKDMGEKLQVALYYEKIVSKGKKVVSNFLRSLIQNIPEEEIVRIFSEYKDMAEVDILLKEYVSDRQMSYYKTKTWWNTLNDLKSHNEPDQAIVRLFCNSEIDQHIANLRQLLRENGLEEIRKIQKKCSNRTATICAYYLIRHEYENAYQFFKETMSDEQQQYFNEKYEKRSNIYNNIRGFMKSPVFFSLLFQDTKGTMKNMIESFQVALCYEKEKKKIKKIFQSLRSCIQNISQQEVIQNFSRCEGVAEAEIFLKEYASDKQMLCYQAYKEKKARRSESEYK